MLRNTFLMIVVGLTVGWGLSALTSDPPALATSPASSKTTRAQVSALPRPTAVTGGSSPALPPDDEVARLRLENAVLSGQVNALQGTESLWPDQAPETLTPERYTGLLRTLFADEQLGTLGDVDCSEYPCVAVVARSSPDASWGEAVRSTLTRALSQGNSEGIGGVGLWVSQSDGAEGSVGRMAIALMPTDFNEEAKQRLAHRAHDALAADVPSGG